MTIERMKDFVGREIHLGDHVVHFTTKYKRCHATRDTVCGFTEKRLYLNGARGPVCPSNVVIYVPVMEE